ncbi:hypothetical protein [Flavobacterium sp.]|uniref:hypothetical protein n=1 Tax=Flavobacterium sp. TaxID=239 RepID=UPI003D0B00A8
MVFFDTGSSPLSRKLVLKKPGAARLTSTPNTLSSLTSDSDNFHFRNHKMGSATYEREQET